MKIKITKLLASTVLTICCAGLARADLGNRIYAIISDSSQKKVQFSINIMELNSARTVFRHNANTPLVPASNMKIIITTVALKYLGPEYEYKTKVGLCDNTLVLIGSGDPLFGDKVTDAKYHRSVGWILEDIAETLKTKHITAINDIVVDTSIFDDERVHPNWPADQLNQWYACEVSGLNYNDNCIDMTVKNSGGNITIIAEPKTAFVKIINEVTAIKRGSGAVGAYRNQELNKITVKGKCKNQQGPFPVAIERPAAFFAFLLAENLIVAGVGVQGRLIEKPLSKDCEFKQLGEYTTAITDCLSRCNKNSLGLAAESLLKTIGANANPDRKNGGWARGREVISRYLLSLGIKADEFYVDDGSGLSRQNRLSANAITTVMLDVYKSKNWPFFKNSLAVGGVDGTIYRYFKQEKYKGRILGKTGYIAGAKSFSGLCSTAGGDYVFSILANNANGKTRAAINSIAEAIIDETDK